MSFEFHKDTATGEARDALATLSAVTIIVNPDGTFGAQVPSVWHGYPDGDLVSAPRGGYSTAAGETATGSQLEQATPHDPYNYDGDTGTKPAPVSDASDAKQKFFQAVKSANKENLDIELADVLDAGETADFTLKEDGTLTENKPTHGDHIIIIADGDFDKCTAACDDLVLKQLGPMIDTGSCHIQRCENDGAT